MSSDRRQPGQSWESFAERRLREAMESGAFDNLPGFGAPIPDIDDPWDENSWVRRKLRDEQLVVLPPLLEARLKVQQFHEELPRVPTEAEVRKRVAALNEAIHRAHFSHQPGPPISVPPLEADAIVAEWRQRAGKDR